MKYFITLVLAFIGLSAYAYPCLPAHISGTGMYYTETKTADGISRSWVCVDAAGKPSFEHLSNLYDFVPPPDCARAALALGFAMSPAAASAAVGACRVTTSALIALELAGKAAVKAKWDADHPNSTLVWRTPNSGTLTLYNYAAGKLGSPIFSRKAPANALCNCSVARATSGTSTYCAVDGGAANEVTYCLQR